MVELEPTETSHEIMKCHDTKKVVVQCTDYEKGPLPEQVDNKQNDHDSTELAIGAAEDTDPSIRKKEHCTDNIDATVVTKDSSVKSDFGKICKLAAKSAKEEANEVRKWQSNWEEEVGSKVDLESEEVDNKNRETVKNNEKCISDKGTWEKEKHEEESLEKTDKEKETDTSQRKKKRRRYPKSKKKQVSSSSEHVDQQNKEMEVPGVLSATGGKQGGVKSASNNTNTTNGSRRQSTRWHPSGGDSLGSISGGGGCGGEPPTPPEEWKEKAPCDGYVETKRRNKRPSKRLITRQDSHTSLPSVIRHGTAHVLNQSPENQNNQAFSLPPIGVPAPTDLVIENFVQPAFAHIQSQPSFVKWRTHHCQSCKTMQACFRHVHGCKGQLLCDICRKLFDEVNHHVSVCQRSDEDMCGMEFCKEFYQATEQGKDVQFEILAKFAASFYDTELTDIPYPIQRQQSVSVNGTGAGNDAFEPSQDILSNDLEEDLPTSGDDDDDDDNSDEEQPSAHDQKTDISPPSPGSHGDAPVPIHDTNEQRLSGTANRQPPQRPQSLHQSSISTGVNPSGSAMPTTQSRRLRMPYTVVNKTAVVDHLTNKQYKTKHELHLDTASARQYAQAPPMWKREIDKQEEPCMQRGKVVYGERRHLRAFLLVLDDLQKQLRNGHAVSDQEEGVIFCMNMKIEGNEYKQGDQYVKMAQLGSGAFGKVYLCKDNATHYEFVIKMISLDHFSPDEALIWSQMNHPNIVQLLGVIRCGGMIYFFSEYVANMNLKSLVANGRVMGQGEALYHMEQLLNILRYVHAQKVVHRDLKPENILVTAEGRLLLIDWGLAKMVRGEYLTGNQNPEGTQHYMAPEVAKCEAYNFAADIWSIMCIGIYLISGLPPWMQRFGNVPLLFYVIGTKSPPLEDIPEETNEQVRDLLVRGLTVEPEQRPSADDLLEHPAFELTTDLQNVEAVSPKQKMNQQIELEMAKIADAPGEWRPRFAPADDNVDFKSFGSPFSGLTTPETTGGPPKSGFQDVPGSRMEEPASGDYARRKQPIMDVQISGSAGVMQQSDVKSSVAAPASTASTESVPPEQEVTPLHLRGGEGSLEVQEEPVVAFKAPSFSLVDAEIGSQQPGGGISMPEYDYSHLPIIRPPQSLPDVEEAEACEHDDQKSLADSNISKDIKDIPQRDTYQSPSAEFPHSSTTLPYSTSTSQNQSLEDKEQSSPEAELNQANPKASTNPDSITIASSAIATLSPSPAVSVVPTTTPDDVKQFPEVHGEDGNTSVGSNTAVRHSGTTSSHQSHSATSTRFQMRHQAYHEEQFSYGSIPLTSVHSSEDIYGPSLDVRINQDFPTPSDAPSQAQVKGQPEPEQEVPLDVQPGPNPSSLTEVEFSQWTETEVTAFASGTRVEVVRETEAVYGDPKSSTASAIEVLCQEDKMTPDGKMEEDMELLQQFAAVTLGGSASISNLLFNAHAGVGRTTATSTASESTSNIHQVVQSSSMGHFNSQSIGVRDPTRYEEDTSGREQNSVEVKIPMDIAAIGAMTSTDLLISRESNPSVSMECSSSLPKQQGDSVIPSAQQMVSEDPQTTRQVQPPSTLNLLSILKTSPEDPQMSNVQTKPPSGVDPASPPKMLREDQPGATFPPPQSAVLGSPYEPSSMCSWTSSDMSLRRSLSGRKMPSCKLAPIFSETCGLCEEEPLNNLHQTNPHGSSLTSRPNAQVIATADSPTRALSREYNQLLGATVNPDQDKLPGGRTQAKETSSESDISGSQESQLNGACNYPPSTSVGHQVAKTSSDTSSRDDLFQDARAMPLSATETNADVDKLLGGACNLASRSGAGQLSADPEATKPSSTSDARGGDIVQFLTDDDEWRFSLQTQGIGGCMLGASTPIHARPIIESTPSDDAYRPSSYPSFEQAASNISADEMYMQFAANNLMQQASCAESVEDQLVLMNEVMEMDLSFHTASASLSLEKIGTPGQMTSGVFTSSAQGPSPTYEVTKSIATLQQQLSTVSSSSSMSNGGTKVTVVIDSNQENHISIRMGRDQTIKDLAVGIRAQVPIGIETFTLQVIDHGKPLSERDTIGSEELMFVIVPDPPDNTWTWRVRRACGTLEYSDSLLG